MLLTLKKRLPTKKLCLLLLLFYFIQVLPVNASISSWIVKKPIPTPRGQSVVISGDDELIYVIGGLNSTNGTALPSVEAYNHVLDIWVTRSPLPKATMGAAGAKGLDGTIYVISGSGPGRESTQVYNPSLDTWTEKAPIPVPVWEADAATGEDGKIYVIGGVGGTNLVQIYDPDENTWSSGSPMPTPRSELGVIKGKNTLIYAIGGCSSTEEIALSTVEIYNPDTNTWYTGEPLPKPRCHFAITLGPLGNIYVIGGSDSYYSNTPPFYDTVYSYNTSTNTWKEEEPTISTARRELEGATVANKIFAIGGANVDAIYLDINEMTIIPDTKGPMADAGEDVEVIQGEAFLFNGSRSMDDIGIANYTWTFIDITPQSLTGIKPTYIFETAGLHLIILTVTDWGGNSDTDNVIVMVRDIEAPVVDAWCDKRRIQYDSPLETYRVEPGTAITFYTSGSVEDIVKYEWAFGDGNIGSGPSPSYTYLTLGVYIVQLTVEDSAGNTGYDNIMIVIEEKEESSITCSISPSNIAIGSSISVSGKLSPNISLINITLIYTTPPPTQILNTFTILSADSTFNDTFSPYAVGSWSVKAHWDGNEIVKGSTSQEIPFTVSKSSSSISCDASMLIVSEGESITIFGSTTPIIPDAIVTLIYIGPEGTVLNETKLTDVDGAYSDSITLSEKGVWKVRASWEGDEMMEEAISNEVSVTVTDTFRFPVETLISSFVIILVLTSVYFLKPKKGF